MADKVPTLTREAAELSELIADLGEAEREATRAAVVAMAAAVANLKKLPNGVGSKMWDVTVTFVRKAMVASMPGVRVLTKTPEAHFNDIRAGLDPRTLAMLDEATGRAHD